MKRFYKEVAVRGEEGGHAVLLDGKPVRTPAKQSLLLPNARLAEALAEEWEAQEAKVRPPSMPLTQLACTAIDQTRSSPQEILEETAAYAGNDLLCYRVERPAALRQRQHDLWQPLLDWAALRYDAPLQITSAILSVAQPESSLAALRAPLLPLDDFTLTALSQTVRITGSLVLGLALLEAELDAEAAFERAELDEAFQLEQWGEDAEAVRKRALRLGDLVAAERFMRLLADPRG